MKNIILCDIDGTVANNDHRQHFLEGKKDWDGFFDALDKDKPISLIINKIIRENESGKNIIFLTGRPERYRKTTRDWLTKYFNFVTGLVTTYRPHIYFFFFSFFNFLFSLILSLDFFITLESLNDFPLYLLDIFFSLFNYFK